MLISIDEINKSLKNKRWTSSNNMISKKYKFKSFKKCIEFINIISSISENMNHHPIIKIDFNQITIEIFSQEFNGVTTKCINLALKFDHEYKIFNKSN